MYGLNKCWTLFAGTGLLVSGPALADVKTGVDAWTRGEYDAAVAQWNGPAARGDADAQFNMAQAYKLGRGVKQDLAKAEELFGKAAAQGHLQASDNYGLLLFQRGDRTRAMPFLKAASDRGDPRAQYLLGIAHFNGDIVAKDWVRAYALVSLAQQAGLTQASGALAQMDQYIPIEQRQQSVALAQELSTQAEATRARQLASAGLGTTARTAPSSPPPPVAGTPNVPVITAQTPPRVATARTVPTVGGSPREAGADFARPRTAPPQAAPQAPAVAAVSRAAPPPAATTRIAPPAPAAQGAWRIQLGAFSVAGNAEALWNRVKTRPEVAGHGRALVPGGSVTRLQATGYASEDAARSACARLTSAGFDCRIVRN